MVDNNDEKNHYQAVNVNNSQLSGDFENQDDQKNLVAQMEMLNINNENSEQGNLSEIIKEAPLNARGTCSLIEEINPRDTNSEETRDTNNSFPYSSSDSSMVESVIENRSVSAIQDLLEPHTSKEPWIVANNSSSDSTSNNSSDYSSDSSIADSEKECIDKPKNSLLIEELTEPRIIANDGFPVLRPYPPEVDSAKNNVCTDAPEDSSITYPSMEIELVTNEDSSMTHPSVELEVVTSDSFPDSIPYLPVVASTEKNVCIDAPEDPLVTHASMKPEVITSGKFPDCSPDPSIVNNITKNGCIDAPDHSLVTHTSTEPEFITNNNISDSSPDSSNPVIENECIETPEDSLETDTSPEEDFDHALKPEEEPIDFTELEKHFKIICTDYDDDVHKDAISHALNFCYQILFEFSEESRRVNLPSSHLWQIVFEYENSEDVPEKRAIVSNSTNVHTPPEYDSDFVKMTITQASMLAVCTLRKLNISQDYSIILTPLAREFYTISDMDKFAAHLGFSVGEAAAMVNASCQFGGYLVPFSNFSCAMVFIYGVTKDLKDEDRRTEVCDGHARAYINTNKTISLSEIELFLNASAAGLPSEFEYLHLRKVYRSISTTDIQPESDL